MICERVLGNTAGAPAAASDQEQDVVELHWHECPRRALRRRSRQGRDVAILLPPGQVLRHGDILFQSESLRITIDVIPSNILVARPRTASELAVLAFELGNLHVPVEITDDAVCVAPDGPVEEVLERVGLPFELQVRRFAPLFTAGGAAVSLSPDLKIIRR